jgi:Leucine-rich repeat (LRR) protein
VTQLKLYKNQIKELNPLSTLKNQDHLIIGKNQVSDLRKKKYDYSKTPTPQQPFYQVKNKNPSQAKY